MPWYVAMSVASKSKLNRVRVSACSWGPNTVGRKGSSSICLRDDPETVTARGFLLLES